MPLRKSGEPLNKYVSRFMDSKRERKKFPNPKQRAAVAYSESRKRK